MYMYVQCMISIILYPIDSINGLQASHNTVNQDIQKIKENQARDGKKYVYSVFTISLATYT